MKKRVLTFLLAGIMAITMPITVMADREDAALDTPYVSLGADLTAKEKATVLELLGVTEEDLKNYTVASITNKDEHEYLGSYLDASVIGTRALSSVLVEGKEAGYGIQIETQNITYCTVGMYQNAFVTAGIEDADIKVAGPFNISGTAALVGAIKSYENMTGEVISPESVDTATDELVTTSELGETIGDSEKAEQLIGAVKEKVVEADNVTEEQVGEIVDQAAEELEVDLSEEDRQKIIDLMAKIDELNLDIDALKEQAADFYDKLEGLDLNLDDIDTAQVEGFFAKIWNGIVNFFQNIGN